MRGACKFYEPRCDACCTGVTQRWRVRVWRAAGIVQLVIAVVDDGAVAVATRCCGCGTCVGAVAMARLVTSCLFPIPACALAACRYEVGVAVQFFGDVPPCDLTNPKMSCLEKDGQIPACCTSNCQVGTPR